MSEGTRNPFEKLWFPLQPAGNPVWRMTKNKTSFFFRFQVTVQSVQYSNMYCTKTSKWTVALIQSEYLYQELHF